MTFGLLWSFFRQIQSLSCCRGWCALAKGAAQVVFWLLWAGHGGTVDGYSSTTTALSLSRAPYTLDCFRIKQFSERTQNVHRLLCLVFIFCINSQIIDIATIWSRSFPKVFEHNVKHGYFLYPYHWFWVRHPKPVWVHWTSVCLLIFPDNKLPR